MTENIRTLESLERVGGALCLDFVNTINSRVNPEYDYLIQYSDLMGWANKVEILSPAQANQLQKRAKQNIEGAEKALQRGLELRELFYRLFSSATNAVDPTKKDMEAFVSVYGEAISRGQLIKANDHFMPRWQLDESFDAMLWPVIHSAGELLQSDDLTGVKECPGCRWLFLDSSKNQSRRWCSMNTCGARDKMRRYHNRKRAK